MTALPAPAGLFETHLTVSDLDRSVAFYRDVVGLPVALELPERGAAFVWIKNMAVAPAHRGRGIGARLIEAAVERARAEGRTTLAVATAAADAGNLRFYQRAGFRLRSIERDAFTPATGYPAATLIDGVELRDRVWLDRDVG